jgi:hypothetical protein
MKLAHLFNIHGTHAHDQIPLTRSPAIAAAAGAKISDMKWWKRGKNSLTLVESRHSHISHE